MTRHFLDFEQPIAELEAKISELRMVGSDSEVNISEEITRLEKKCRDLTAKIFSNLTPWQTVKMARHPERPQTLDYIENIFSEFDELHGDRHYSIGPTIVAGVARFANIPVMVMGHQKGRKTKNKVYRNFGMAQPEDYRKALRLMRMAEKFNLPIISFIDTAGAYPGIEAEKHNQSEAIARNLFVMAELKTPIICFVIGEGGSGGALGIGIGDRFTMLQYSTYSVISPEGCASILWKDQEYAETAAKALGVTSERILELGLIDHIIEEPLGGAHRDREKIYNRMKHTITDQLATLLKMPIDDLVEARYQRLMSMGT